MLQQHQAIIRILNPDDADVFAQLRQKSLNEAPLAFGDGLVGFIGVFRDRREKTRHKAHIWGMYVASEYRGKGLGSQLLDSAISHAKMLAGISVIHLSVTSASPDAHALYKAAGFRPWGTDTHSIRHNGDGAAEIHMMLEVPD